MLEASRVRLPGVEEGASEAGGSIGSQQGRRQERAEVEARAELRTPAREIQRQAAAGCEREQREQREQRLREREAGAGNAAAIPTRSLTHSSSYPNGPAKGGPNSLAGPNSPSPELVVRLV